MSLSTDLQAAISQLQTDHSSLVTAVRARNGVSGATNTAIASKLASDVTIQTKVDSLRAAVAVATTESLSLDFANDLYQTGRSSGGGLTKGNLFSDLITFSRASSATRTNREGRVEIVAAGQPRFDYDPLTLAIKGLMIEEGRTNLVTRSGSLNKWVIFNVIVSPSNIVAPDGTLNATKVVHTVDLAWHQIRSAAFSVVSGTTYTTSVYAKKAENDTIRVTLENASLFPANSAGVFNLTNGTVVSGAGARITSVGDGWYRCSVTSACTTSGTTVTAFGIGSSGPAGDGVSGSIFWGGQVEAGAFATSYIPTPESFASRSSTATYLNSQGLIQTAASGVARSDSYSYDALGVLRPVGLLIEGSATNLISSSDDYTGWANTGPGGSTSLTLTPNSSSGPRGSNTMCLVARSDSTARYLSKSFSAGGALAQTLTFSQYAKPAGVGDFLSMRIQCTYPIRVDSWFNLLTGECGYSKNGDVTVGNVSMTKAANGAWLCEMTVTNGASPWMSCAVTPASGPFQTDSTVGSLASIYLDCSQLEVGSSRTAYIPTTTAQGTRAADVSTSSQSARSADYAVINTLGPWFNSTEGTLSIDYIQLQNASDNGYAGVFSPISAGSYAAINGTSGAQTGWHASGSSKPRLNTGVFNKQALTYTSSNYLASASNGGTVYKSSSSDYRGASSKLSVGSREATGFLNGCISQLRYFPRRFTDLELQALTA